MKTMKIIKLRMAIVRAARERNKADAERYTQFIQKLKVIRSSQSEFRRQLIEDINEHINTNY